MGYIVRILPPNREPTLVYNCNHVPTLCGAAIKYLGPGVTTGDFHYDGKAERKEKRRRTSCPDTWITQIVNGRPRCPEANQPALWKYEGNSVGVPTAMWMDAQGVVSDRWLSNWELNSTTGQFQYVQVPVRLSCDEFPPARYFM